MDKTTRILADYVTNLEFAQLPAAALHQAKRRLIDTLGCAAGGYTSEPSTIAQRVAARQHGEPALWPGRVHPHVRLAKYVAPGVGWQIDTRL